MASDKLSVSLDADLVATIRAAAADEGVSISTWLGEAATAKARQRLLREALDAAAEEDGGLTDAEIAELVFEARKTSFVTRPDHSAA